MKNQFLSDHSHASPLPLTHTDTAAGVSQHMVNKLVHAHTHTHSHTLGMGRVQCAGGEEVFYSLWTTAQFGFI